MSRYFICLEGFSEQGVKALKGYKERLEKRFGSEVSIGTAHETAEKLCKFNDKGNLQSGAPTDESIRNQHLLVVVQKGLPHPKQSYQAHLFFDPILIRDGKIVSEYFESLESSIESSVKRIRLLRDKIYASYGSSPFLLPISNFSHGEFSSGLLQLRNEIDSQNCTFEKVSSVVDEVDSKLRRLRKPNRPVTQERVYHDQKGRVYKFATFDLHGGDPRLESHEDWCVINGYFRLGCRINSCNHYDVTRVDGTSLNRSLFLNCHGSEPSLCDGHRANIWPNDFRIDKGK